MVHTIRNGLEITHIIVQVTDFHRQVFVHLPVDARKQPVLVKARTRPVADGVRIEKRFI